MKKKKLKELKRRFKNKYMIRVVAGVLVIALLGAGSSAYALTAKAAGKDQTTTENVAAAGDDDTEEKLTDALKESLSVSEAEIGKEETVYVISDSTGTATETIVSDHLINNEDKDTIEDASDLKDIKNVKGDETYTESDGKLTWQANGNDIFYQGTSEKDLPVTEKVTYYLDGEEIEPEELAGKSGKVTIRFDYTNHEKVTTEISGKEEEVYVPFVTLTGMVLDDSFSDIEVSNGKVIADGNRSIVVGYALPGLKDSLKVEDSDFDSDFSIPEYFEVTAQVENFSLDMTMTVAQNATNYVSAEGDELTSSIDEMLDSLTDATDQLKDGSEQLADGIDTLSEKMGEFSEGVTSLQEGISAYTGGASTLSQGIGSLKSGIDTLSGSVPTLISGISQLKDGTDDAADGASDLADGASQVSDGVSTLAGMLQNMGTTLEESKEGAKSTFASSAGISYDSAASVISALQSAQENLKTGISYEVQAAGYLSQATNYLTQEGTSVNDTSYLQLTGAAQQCSGAAQQYYNGVLQALAAQGMSFTITNATEASAAITSIGNTIAKLQNGIGQVEGATSALDQVEATLGSEDTQTKLNALVKGASDLATGASKLSDGVDTLQAGMTELNSKVGTLSSGATQLKDGSSQLASGAASLVKNNDTLNSGAAKITDATNQLTEGIGTLKDGAHQLDDGMAEFKEEAIDEIVNSYNGDVKLLLERIQAVFHAGEDYQTYTDLADGVNGSVKFIIKTASVEAE